MMTKRIFSALLAAALSLSLLAGCGSTSGSRPLMVKSPVS